MAGGDTADISSRDGCTRAIDLSLVAAGGRAAHDAASTGSVAIACTELGGAESIGTAAADSVDGTLSRSGQPPDPGGVPAVGVGPAAAASAAVGRTASDGARRV